MTTPSSNRSSTIENTNRHIQLDADVQGGVSKLSADSLWNRHCHIANHAAFGLAAQIMERRQDSADRWPRVDPIVKDGIHFGGSNALAEVTKGCNNWLMWSRDCNNWWPGDGAGCNYTEEIFAPDSGI